MLPKQELKVGECEQFMEGGYEVCRVSTNEYVLKKDGKTIMRVSANEQD